MSAVMSNALREEMLAVASEKRDSTVAAVEKMYRMHLQKAASHQGNATVSQENLKKVESTVIQRLSL